MSESVFLDALSSVVQVLDRYKFIELQHSVLDSNSISPEVKDSRLYLMSNIAMRLYPEIKSAHYSTYWSYT